MSTENMIVSARLEEPRAPLAAPTLPCGWVDADGKVHRDIELRELTGHEEDLLSSNQIPSYKKMGMLLGRCITRVGEITDRGKLAHIANQLLLGDRVYLLFMIRRITLGDEYPFKTKCPSCGGESMFKLNLSHLETQEMPEPEKRIYEGTLPRSGKKYSFRMLNGFDEEKLAQWKGKNDKLSAALWTRMESLDGLPPSLQDIKALGMADREHIRVHAEEVDGGVDTTMEMRCPLCGHEFAEELDAGQPGFFFPSMTLKRSKTRSST